MSAAEVKKLDRFVEHTDRELKRMMGNGTSPAIGGVATYMVTPTTLGEVYKGKCSGCNKEFDLTDYSRW